MKIQHIQLVEHTPQWHDAFLCEAYKIKKVMGDNCKALYHIGSTSVPSLLATPVIDILCVVRNLNEIDCLAHAWQSLGYRAYGEQGIEGRRYFTKVTSARALSIHIYQAGNAMIANLLAFRNHLRKRKDVCRAYSHLKLILKEQYGNDLQAYNQAKSSFIEAVLTCRDVPRAARMCGKIKEKR